MTFHSYRPTEAAVSDAQFGQVAPEMPSPLVNLSVERVPPSGQSNDPVIASMLLADMNRERAFGGNPDEAFVKLAADKRNFEDALN